MQGLDFAVFIVYLLLLFLFTNYGSKSIQDEKSYLLANRNITFFPLLATLVMTEFNTSTLIGFSSVGGLVGLWGILLPSVFLFGLLFYTFVAAKKWKEFNGISTSGFFSLKYGKTFGRFSSILLLLAMSGFSATYVKSMTIIFGSVFPNFHPNWISAFLVFLIFLLTIRGGLVSIIRADLFGLVSIFLFIPLTLYFAYSVSSIQTISELEKSFPISKSQEILPPSFLLSLIVLTMFTYISAPWYSQKIFSAKDSQTAFYAVLFASILIFLVYSIPVLATAFFSKANFKIQNFEYSIPSIIANAFPIGLKGFSYGVLFATGATTLFGVWNAMTAMVVGDFLDSLENSKTRTIFISLFFAIVSLVLSILLVDSVLNKLILANVPIAALSFALLGGFYWKRANALGAWVSVVLGIFWGSFCYLYFGESGGYTVYWMFIGIPLIFLSGVIGSLLSETFFGKRNSES